MLVTYYYYLRENLGTVHLKDAALIHCCLHGRKYNVKYQSLPVRIYLMSWLLLFKEWPAGRNFDLDLLDLFFEEVRGRRITSKSRLLLCWFGYRLLAREISAGWDKLYAHMGWISIRYFDLVGNCNVGVICANDVIIHTVNLLQQDHPCREITHSPIV